MIYDFRILQDLIKIEAQMKKSNKSASAWLSQTIFVTISDEMEQQLLNARVENVVSIHSNQLNLVVNEFEQVKVVKSLNISL